MVSALRAVLVFVARAGRATVTVDGARAPRRSNARDDADDVVDVAVRVPVRARAPESVRVAAVARLATLVAVRDTTDASRDVVVAEFVRDNESVPRTAADDAPMASASATIETISFFISVQYRLAKNEIAPQAYFMFCKHKFSKICLRKIC